MPRPRKDLICLDYTPYYHVVSRCVRRTFLCGFDPETRRDYEYRRQWIVDRIRLLASLFAIDICAYAVMKNHYHIALKLEPEQAQSWPQSVVVSRWTSVFKGPLLVQRWQAGETLSKAELNTVNDIIAVWRKRLTSLSWFMKCLNEPIARQANKEDQCTGHFWEARFSSQPLATEAALLACMAYVDLNPVRAGMAATPEGSDYTSVQERVKPRFNLSAAVRSQLTRGTLHHFDTPLKPLSSFNNTWPDVQSPTGIPCQFKDYLELVDWTGRVIRDDKLGFIAKNTPPILMRLQITQQRWLETLHGGNKHMRQKFKGWHGAVDTG